MPSKSVLDALEELHRNLDKMKPAIEQVKLAGKLTEEVNRLPAIHSTFISEIQQVEKEYHELLQKQMQDYGNILNDKANVIVDAASNTISSLTDHNTQLLKLRNNIQSYYSKLDGMQIPKKLDTLQKSSDEKLGKLDSISIKTQSALEDIPAQFENLETNIKEYLKTESENMLKHGQTMKEKIETSMGEIYNVSKQISDRQKAQRQLTFITWAFIIFCTALVLYFKI